MRIIKKTLSIIITFSLTFTPLLQALPLEVDGTTNTSITAAQNGTPVIDIARPNANGLSHNKFNHYNVNANGLILNNSKDTTINTQLGGFIFGNRNLNGAGAQVILNEVTSTSQTQLNGYTEVAGRRADLVIANPNGITVNGAGFINTSAVTLSTGRAILNNGSISHFDVLDGQIDIQGLGLDTSTVDATNIYTNYLILNAKINAKNLNIRLGKNKIDYDTKDVISNAINDEVKLLLDSSALGGMYANRISLVGTDAGLGVNLPPEVLASTGDIFISNDGIISLKNLTANTTLTVQSNSKLENNQILSANDIELSASDILNKGVIYASNDISLSALNTITNSSALIESVNGDIDISATYFENIADILPTKTYTQSSYQQKRKLRKHWRTKETVVTTINTLHKEGYIPAYLLSGKKLNIQADVLNQYSLISALDDITLVGSLDNLSNLYAYNTVQTYGYVQYHKKRSWPHKSRRWKHKYNTYTVDQTLLDAVYSTIQTNKSFIANADNINNGNVKTAQSVENTPPPNFTGSTIILPSGEFGRFVTNKDTDAQYLIETNPDFTVYETFISSEYMMSNINYDADITTKKIGDAYYENKLIQDSIFKQTGKRFLNTSITNNTAQYKYLMDNALQAHASLELSPGISLSKEQINSLNKDIVWMEEKVIAGERVLVPVVYIANTDHFKIDGAKIIANNIDLHVDTINNSGLIQAKNTIDVIATNDINNISGDIKATDIDLESTNGSIVNKQHTKNVTYNTYRATSKRTLVGDGGNIQADNTLNIIAKEDILIQGSNLNANDINLNANNVNITATKEVNTFRGGSSKTYRINNDTTHHASNLQANNINIQTTNTTTIKGSNLQANDTLHVEAKKIDVLAVNNTRYLETKATDSGFMSKKTTLDIELKEKVKSSNLKANNIILKSKEDINLQSANLNANNSVDITSENSNVNLSAKSYTNATYHKTKKSSFGGLKRSLSIDSKSITKLANSSTTAKNNITVGGKNINVMASDLKTDNGDIKLIASQNVNIISGEEISSEKHIREKSSFKLGLSGSKFTYGEITKDKDTKTTSTNKASNINTKNLTILSGVDTNVIASNITADSMTVDAKRDFNVLADKNTESTTKEHSKQDLGIELTLNTEEVSLFTGYWEDVDGKKTTTHSVAKSNINVDTLHVDSKNTNIIVSDIIANDIDINSQNIRVLSDTTDTKIHDYTKKIKAGVSVGVRQNISAAVEAVDSVSDAKSNSATASRSLKAYDAVTTALQRPIEAGVSAIFEQSQTDTHSNNQQVVSSTLYAQNSLKLNAVQEIEVAGSNLISNNTLELNAKTINLHSSQENYSTSTTSSSSNAKGNLFGSNMGELTLGFQDSDLDVEGTREINSHLYAQGKAKLNSQEDTILKGATVDANELELHVGRNLVMQSIQDTEKTKGSSKGGSISGNVLTGAPTGFSANGGKTKGSKRWIEEVTSLNANEKITVAVNEKTTLTGASITNLDNEKVDQGNLEFTTNTLAIADIKDYNNYKSTSMGIGIGSTSKSNPKLNSIEYSKNTKEKEQITRATIGSGIITTSSDTSKLNRDTNKIKEITKDKSSNLELYASDNSIKAILDPVKAKNDIIQYAKDLGLAAHKEIQENIPSAKNKKSNTDNENKDKKNENISDKIEYALTDTINSTVGALLDEVSFAGILPSKENGGGYVSQIATQLFGDNRNVLSVKDKQTLINAGVSKNDIQEVTLVKTNNGIKQPQDIKEDDIELDRVTVYITDPNKAIRIDENYNENDPLNDYKIHLSSQDIENSGVKHLFTNGMFNNTDTALYNQQKQQANADSLLNYNQQHGIVGDVIEDAQDHLTSILGISSLGTGSARQTGEVITQMTTITKGDITISAHSQGTMMSQNGLDQNRETISKIVQDNKDSKFLVQYAGAPVNHNTAEDLITDIYGGEEGIKEHFGENSKVSDVFRSQVAPEDFVGSVLGWQSAGINNSENLGENILQSSKSFTRVFGSDSTHSYYPCVIGCGDDNFVPEINHYLDANNIDGRNESPITDYYNNNFTTPVNTKLFPQSVQDKSSLQISVDMLGNK